MEKTKKAPDHSTRPPLSRGGKSSSDHQKRGEGVLSASTGDSSSLTPTKKYAAKAPAALAKPTATAAKATAIPPPPPPTAAAAPVTPTAAVAGAAAAPPPPIAAEAGAAGAARGISTARGVSGGAGGGAAAAQNECGMGDVSREVEEGSNMLENAASEKAGAVGAGSTSSGLMKGGNAATATSSSPTSKLGPVAATTAAAAARTSSGAARHSPQSKKKILGSLPQKESQRGLPANEVLRGHHIHSDSPAVSRVLPRGTVRFSDQVVKNNNTTSNHHLTAGTIATITPSAASSFACVSALSPSSEPLAAAETTEAGEAAQAVQATQAEARTPGGGQEADEWTTSKPPAVIGLVGKGILLSEEAASPPLLARDCTPGPPVPGRGDGGDGDGGGGGVKNDATPLEQRTEDSRGGRGGGRGGRYDNDTLEGGKRKEEGDPKTVAKSSERGADATNELDAMVSLSRQVSKGYTGETWYDFDLPLGRSDPITIIHFNDVYNIESPSKGPGGVSRFVTAMQQYQHLHPFILFSGDVFNPSVMSTYTRGRHMVPFLNILKIHTACFGNHDFDFGVDELEYSVGSCNFPWLLSNVFQKTEVEEQLQLHLRFQQQRRSHPQQLTHPLTYSTTTTTTCTSTTANNAVIAATPPSNSSATTTTTIIPATGTTSSSSSSNTHVSDGAAGGDGGGGTPSSPLGFSAGQEEEEGREGRRGGESRVTSVNHYETEHQGIVGDRGNTARGDVDFPPSPHPPPLPTRERTILSTTKADHRGLRTAATTRKDISPLSLQEEQEQQEQEEGESRQQVHEEEEDNNNHNDSSSSSRNTSEGGSSSYYCVRLSRFSTLRSMDQSALEEKFSSSRRTENKGMTSPSFSRSAHFAAPRAGGAGGGGAEGAGGGGAEGGEGGGAGVGGGDSTNNVASNNKSMEGCGGGVSASDPSTTNIFTTKENEHNEATDTGGPDTNSHNSSDTSSSSSVRETQHVVGDVSSSSSGRSDDENDGERSRSQVGQAKERRGEERESGTKGFFLHQKEKTKGPLTKEDTDKVLDKSDYDRERQSLKSNDDADEGETETSGRFVEDYIEVHGLPLANGMKYRLCEWQGIKVGLIGLVESEWLDTLGSIDQDDVCYVDFVRAANCLSRVLRQKECELVIALTHMRAPNDEKLAREAEDIDLILGGHDHDYYGLQRIGNVPVVKSGTDFRDFTVLTIYPGSTAAANKSERSSRCSSSSSSKGTSTSNSRSSSSGSSASSGNSSSNASSSPNNTTVSSSQKYSISSSSSNPDCSSSTNNNSSSSSNSNSSSSTVDGGTAISATPSHPPPPSSPPFSPSPSPRPPRFSVQLRGEDCSACSFSSFSSSSSSISMPGKSSVAAAAAFPAITSTAGASSSQGGVGSGGGGRRGCRGPRDVEEDKKRRSGQDIPFNVDKPTQRTFTSPNLLALPTGGDINRRCRNTSNRRSSSTATVLTTTTSSGSGNGGGGTSSRCSSITSAPTRLTKSAGSSPYTSPRWLGGSSSSASTTGGGGGDQSAYSSSINRTRGASDRSFIHLLPPGLMEAKPRTTKDASPARFSGPLRPTDMTEGQEEMPFFLGGSRVHWKRVHVDPEVYPKNVHVERLVQRYEQQVQDQMEKYLVDLGCEFDTRFCAVRTRETNAGSWLCDIMRRECKSEIAILNSGTIRSDCLFLAGELKFGDLARMLPMTDDLCVIQVRGETLLQALENSVSLLPRTDGRFLQVSGLRFCFDSRLPPGQRILRDTVRVASSLSRGLTSVCSRLLSGGVAIDPTSSRSYSKSRSPRKDVSISSAKSSSSFTYNASSFSSSSFYNPISHTNKTLQEGDHGDNFQQDEADFSNFDKIDPSRYYSVATKTYVAQGRDGYHMLTGCKVLVEAELFPPLPTMVREALSMAELANGLKRPHSRIVFKRLTSFTSMQEDELLKDFGCKVNESSRYVLAPRTDGRIRDIAEEQQ